MSDTTVPGEFRTRRSLEDVYDMYARSSDMKDVFYDWGGFNQWLFVQINSFRGEPYDQAMVVLSDLGQHELFPHYLALIAAYVVLSSLFRRLTGGGMIRARLTVWFGILLVLLAGFAVTSATVLAAKDYFKYPRPYVELAKQDIHLLEVEEKKDDGLRSFPSGHVAFITLMVIALWPAFREDWKWYSLSLVAAEGWSRVSLGVHYPADVVGTFLMTAIIVVAVRAVIYTALRKLFNIIC